MRLTRCLVTLSCVFALFSYPEKAGAQTATGTILGTITDPTGAVVPQATVELANERMGFTRSMTTNADGSYEFRALLPGTYTVVATAAGFKKSEAKDVLLQVEQRARVDMTLAVGTATETVSVTAGAPLVHTDDASLGQVVEQKQIVTLPLNGRHFMELAGLVPGVNEGAPGFFGASVHGHAVTANGARAEFNSYFMDGVDNNDEFSFAFNVTPSLDAIEEFKVQTGMFSAEFGRSAGAVVNLVTRSGSNQFHGTLFEFLRNDKLDARDYFAPANAPKPPYRQNQYGFSVGGPIVRNSAFFFVNYEGTKIRQAGTTVATVPTAAMKAGDLRGLAPIYDPDTSRRDPNNPTNIIREPFPNNLIPQNRISPISKNVLPYWPDPNNGDLVRNYVQSLSAKTDTDRWVGRVDQNLGSKDRIFGRFAYDENPHFVPGALPQTGGTDYPDANRGLTLNWTRTISPRLVNEAKAGYNRMRWGYFPQNAGKDLAAQLGLTNIATSPESVLSFPSISVAGMNAPSDTIPFFYINNRYQFIDSLSYIVGSHTVKMGFEHSRIQTNTIGYGPLQGVYGFTNRFTNVSSVPGSGHAFADFLLGDLTSKQLLTSAPLQYFRGRHYSGYFADDWKVTSRLTLSLGLRYENQRPFFEKYDRMVSYDQRKQTLIFPETAPIGDFFQTVRPDLPTTFRDERSDYDPDNNNFAPRFGFAYRPTTSNRTVIRGGFGIFYSGWMTDIFENTGTAPPFVARQRFTADAVTPNLGWNEQGVAFAKTPYALYMMADRNVVNAYIEQWAVNVQHMLGANMMLDIGYVGHHGLKLPGVSQINAAPTPSLDPLQPRRYDAHYDSIINWGSNYNSWHNSMTASLEKRYSKGLQFMASYTLGKTIDDTSTVNSTAFQRYPTGPGKFDRGLASYDIRQRFVANFIYDLPFGRGQALAGDAKGVAGALISGWRTGGIVTLRTGFWLTPTLSRDNLNQGLTSFPIRTADGNLSSGQSINGWFDPAAFLSPAFGIQGNAGRNILEGPGLRTLNWSLMKDTQIREGKERFEFRAEFFNLFNHPNWSAPNTAIDLPQFGKIFGTSISMRQIQFAAKLYF